MSTLANSGTAILLVTHELADVVPEINRVVLMNKGRVVADGKKEETLQVDRLRDLSESKYKWPGETGTIICGKGSTWKSGASAPRKAFISKTPTRP